MADLINAWRFRLPLDRQRAFLRLTRPGHSRLLDAFRAADARAATACVREEYALVRKAVAGG
jgi:DNA-binding GntR family transcriptional regulator